MTIVEVLLRAWRIVTDRNTTMAGLWTLVKGFIRGSFYIVWYRLTKDNVIIRFPFMAYAPVRICGTGSVFIDERCSVFYSIFRGLTIHTLGPDAKVTIGKGCDLGGLTIRCRSRVTLGDKVMTAACLVQDTLSIHEQDLRRKEHDEATGNGLSVRPVSIGNHVWLAAGSGVLAGASIGDDSVVSIGSCVLGENMPEGCLLAGNPVKRPMRIDRILALKGLA